ncbi:kinesin-like protein KIF27 [Folsomia candida]|nr:kinesin-like protein KIF27 [Folsomia candida]
MESPNNIPLMTGTTDDVVGGEKETGRSLNSKEMILDNEKSYQNQDNFNLQNHVNSDFDPEEFISSSPGSVSGGEEFDDDDDDFSNEGDKENSSASESEEDLDFLDEDECSESEPIFDDALLKFRQKLDSKVDDAERFFDRGVLRGRKSVNVGIQTEEEPIVPSYHSSNIAPLRSSSRINCEINGIKCVETQTDDTSVSGLLLSSFREDPECARSEVAKLRDAREPLNLERKRMIKRLKAAKKANETSGYRVRWEEEEKQLFELEEAIEAIDLAIEFKNEIICGGQSSVLLDELAPGQERAELVTRLASLSVFDLQRLFCKVFVKVVELRSSAKELERNVDKLERESKQMRRTISINRKTLKEKDEEHENGIKRLLRECAKTSGAGVASAGGEVIWMTQELSKAKRKLIDFQHALTELLVRHGYLIDGADFDVKHVVRMLGIDFGELNKQLEARPSHHQHHSSIQQHHFTRRNINQRRNAEAENAVPFHLAPSSSSRRPHPPTTNHPFEYGYGGTSSHPHYPQRSNQPHSSSSRYNHHAPFEGYRDRGNGERETIRDRESRHGQGRHVKVHNNHHHQDRTGHFQQVQVHEERLPHGTEVKRLKKKLIIQPNSSQ